MKYYIFITLFGISLSQNIPYFDAKRSMDLLKIQCSFGPRYPGSQGHQQMKTFFENYLRPISDSLYIMNENIPHPYIPRSAHRSVLLWKQPRIGQNNPQARDR